MMAALPLSSAPATPWGDSLRGFVLDVLLVSEEGGRDFLFGDLAEGAGVAGGAGFVLLVS